MRSTTHRDRQWQDESAEWPGILPPSLNFLGYDLEHTLGYWEVPGGSNFGGLPRVCPDLRDLASANKAIIGNNFIGSRNRSQGTCDSGSRASQANETQRRSAVEPQPPDNAGNSHSPHAHEKAIDFTLKIRRLSAQRLCEREHLTRGVVSFRDSA